jgi:hypothetical protein
VIEKMFHSLVSPEGVVHNNRGYMQRIEGSVNQNKRDFLAMDHSKMLTLLADGEDDESVDTLAQEQIGLFHLEIECIVGIAHNEAIAQLPRGHLDRISDCCKERVGDVRDDKSQCMRFA